MDNGGRLAHGAVHGRHHVQVRRDDDGRGMRLGLELARRHGILGRGRRGLLVRIPLLHGLHVLGIGVGRAILLQVVEGRGIGVVVDGRVCLGRHVVVVVLLLGLPATRHVGAGHHGGCETRCCLDSRRRAGTKQPTCEATRGSWRRGEGGRRRAMGAEGAAGARPWARARARATMRMRHRVARRPWARAGVDVRMGESTIEGSSYHDDMSAAEAARNKTRRGRGGAPPPPPPPPGRGGGGGGDGGGGGSGGGGGGMGDGSFGGQGRGRRSKGRLPPKANRRRLCGGPVVREPSSDELRAPRQRARAQWPCSSSFCAAGRAIRCRRRAWSSRRARAAPEHGQRAQLPACLPPPRHRGRRRRASGRLPGLVT